MLVPAVTILAAGLAAAIVRMFLRPYPQVEAV
jgi:hypothetical protein